MNRIILLVAAALCLSAATSCGGDDTDVGVRPGQATEEDSDSGSSWSGPGDTSLSAVYSLPERSDGLFRIYWLSGGADVSTSVDALPEIPFFNDFARSAATVLAGIRTVRLGADGTVAVAYRSGAESERTIGRYRVDDKSTLLFYPDFAQPESRAVDRDALVEGLDAEFRALFVDGLPLAFTADGDDYCFYASAGRLLPFLQALSPLFAEPEVVDMMTEHSADRASAQAVLRSLPDIIDGTSEVEIGLRLRRL